ncbi:protein of unknown function (plasmid) [Cupriavidus neocaledonicus]|uniref:Uncharacterized protein n=1 Tax=Cupriavidus neocaledonicus TaxID=1040979 RepID=A0A375HVE1_9BURK|nr:hypothetical protein CBM2605_B40007 [Cupriavidus neocaledonicus]SPD60996.1 protein of unknown function [Cupriavidus neocaledonicus]
MWRPAIATKLACLNERTPTAKSHWDGAELNVAYLTF